MKKSVVNLFGALAFVALSTVSVQAAGTDTWVGNTDANWNTAGNWTTSGGSTPPANGDSLVFGAAGSSGTSLNNNITSLLLNKLTFNSGASSFTFGGNTFTLGGGIDASALTSGTMTFTPTITIGNGFQRWKVGAGATLAFGSLGSGADATDLYTPNGAVTIISGAGTVKTTTADGWGWRGGSVSGTGPLGPGMVIDNGNNTYDWASVGNQTSGTSRTIVAATYTTAPGGSDSHNVKVTSNTTVSENNAWASLLVTGSTLTVNGTVLNLDTGMILENGGTVAGSAPVQSDNTDGLYIYVPDTGTISSVIRDNGVKKLYKAGLGTLTLSGANSYTGNTVIYEGTIAVGSGIAGTAGAHISSNLGDIGSGQSRTITINNGGNLTFTGGNVFGYDTATLSTVTLVVNQGGVFQTGPTSGTGYFSKIGPVTLNGGTISVGNGDSGYKGALALLGTVTVGGSTPSTIGILSGASTFDVVNLGQSNPGISSGTFNVADVTGDSGADLTVSAGLANQANASAASSITKTGAGTMVLSAANTYTGSTTISAGTLQLGAGGSLANTAIALSGTGALAVKPGSGTTINAGSTGAGSAGATLNLGGQTFDMGDSATSTFNLQQNTSFASTALTIATGATLKFDLGGTTTAADLLAVTKAASVSGTVNVTVNTIGSTALAPATYNIITAASGLSGTWQFTAGGTAQTVTLGGVRSNIHLNNSSTAVSLTVANAYAVTYNGNGNTGGSVPTDSTSYDSGASVTVAAAGSLTKTGYTFNGWNTQANGSGTAYSAGGSFNISSDTTLYAQWALASATITTSSTFPGAVSTTYGTASSPQSVAVSGANLTANITATVTTSGLEISSDGSTWGTTATFTQTGGSASGTLYVRLATNAPVSGSYNSQIVSLASTGASTVNVSTTASGNTVGAKTVTVTGAVAQSKMFDGGTAATLTGTLSGVVNSDNVTLVGMGTFSSSAVGGPYTVTSTSTLGGTAAGNYTLTQPTGLTASILSSAVWTNTVSGLSWSTAANWSNSIVATNVGNTADFSQVDITADTTVNLDQNYTIGNLVFGNTDSSPNANWILANNTLTLAGTTPTVTVGSLGTGKGATISSAIAGTSGLTKTGNGTLTLSGANTYSGATTISTGTLSLANATGAGTSAVAVNSSGTLVLGDNATYANAVTGSGNVKFIYDTTGNEITLNSLSGFTGTVELSLSGANTGGKLRGNNPTWSGTSSLIIDNGTQIYMNGNATFANIQVSGTGNNENRGAIRAQSGTLAGPISLMADTTIGTEGGTISGNISSGASGTQILTLGTANSTGNLTLSGILGGGTGTIALTKTQGGTTTMSGVNTYTGGTTIGAGTLQLQNNSAVLNGSELGTGNVTNNGGTLYFFPSGSSAAVGYAQSFVLNGGTISSEDGFPRLATGASATINVTGSTTLQRKWGHVTGKYLAMDGILQGSSPLTLQGFGGAAGEGAAIWINNANNTYSGTITVSANTGTGGFAMVAGTNNALQFANINLVGTAPGSDTTVQKGGVQFASGVTAPVLGSLAGSGNITLTDLAGTPAAVALTVGGNGGSQTFSGVLSGAGSLTKSGAGTLTLSGANTYTGATTVSGGELAINTGWNYNGNISVASGATLSSTAGNTFGNPPTGTWTIAGTLKANSTSFTVFVLPANVTLNNGALTSLATDTSAWGAMDVNATSTIITANGSANTISAVNIGLEKALTFNTPLSTDALAVSSILGTSSANAQGVTKNGLGTLTLSGGNTYTGNTTISAGTLALTGSGSLASSANIIIAGATFDVSALSSTFALGSGKTLIATNFATGTIAGNLSLASGALALNYTNGTPSLNVTNGTLAFNGNAVTVAVAGSLPHGIYKLISTNSGGLVSGTLPASVTVNGIGTASGSLSISNGELYLTVNHPPVAGNATYTRNAGIYSMRLIVSDLLTNVTDADSDTITLVSVGTSTNGVIVSLSGTNLLNYYNTNNVNDQFSYTVTDGFGGTNTGLVSIVVSNAATGQITGQFTSFTGNVANLTFHGIPNYSYITERSTNLTDWVDVVTNSAATNGVISVTDSFGDLGNVPPASAYYRLKWQP